mmetsp:Transcript_57381/g.65438  ORF Transcript_57381/g.65438 Transcript_57381/m.65438 type:complete len:184 (+) Transcript_57381:286-837(+)
MAEIDAVFGNAETEQVVNTDSNEGGFDFSNANDVHFDKNDEDEQGDSKYAAFDDAGFSGVDDGNIPITEEVDEEERAIIEQRNRENEERMQRIQEKDLEETQKREAKRQAAREALDKWAEERADRLDKQRKLNKEAEDTYLEGRDQLNKSEKPWDSISSLVELKEDGREVARMRATIIAKKND